MLLKITGIIRTLLKGKLWALLDHTFCPKNKSGTGNSCQEHKLSHSRKWTLIFINI